ncbi:MAG: hypothetical protein KY438_11520 [Actinobacteria bacterium]|nr:hypothetical protein [Actinomycetota bacterium]
MRQTLGTGLVFGALLFGLVVAMVKMDSDNTIAWSSVATIGALALPWMVLSKWAEAVLFLAFAGASSVLLTALDRRAARRRTERAHDDGQ